MDTAKANIKNIYPLSPMQEGMLFHSLAQPSSTAYFQQICYSVHGSLNVALFQTAWNEVVRRHDILRTSFVHTDTKRPVQVVYRERRIDCIYRDLRAMPAAEHAVFIANFRSDDRSRPFDLSRDRLMRFAVLQLDDSQYRIIWSHHHIVMDGWSLGIIQREFLDVYAALRRRETPALPPPTQYNRYIRFLEERNREGGQFWNDRLAGYQQVAAIPSPGGNATQADDEIAEFEYTVDQAVASGLKRIAAQRQRTFSEAIQSLWALLLSRYTGLSDVVFGAVISGRPAELPGSESMAGVFINTVPVRVRCTRNMRVADLMEQVHEDALAREPYQHFPLARIQSGHPLKQGLLGTVTVIENYPVAEQISNTSLAELAGFHVSGLDYFEHTHYDFLVQFTPGAELRLKFQFDPKVYPQKLIRRVAKTFALLAEGVVNAEDTPVMALLIAPPEEQVRILEESYGRFLPSIPGTIIERFERQVANNGAAIAIVSDGESLTYAELNRRASHLAMLLRSHGIGPEIPVAICVDRGCPMIVAILAVLKAGGFYVPLDPHYPSERLAFMLRDTGAATVITETRLQQAVLPEARQSRFILLDTDWETAVTENGISLPIDPNNLAYMIYTSGSTGIPKGVGVTHQNVLSLIDSTSGLFDFDQNDVWTFFHSYAFDFSVWELWGALLHGGKLVVVSYEVSRSPEAFLTLLANHEVTVLNQTPSAFEQLANAQFRLDGPTALSRLRYVIFGGEALQSRHLRRWLEQDKTKLPPRLVNMYGITETTVHVTHGAVDDNPSRGETVPAGRAIPGWQLYVLDLEYNPVPVGVSGEIYVGGAGLARGYQHRAALTAERFVPNPFSRSGERLYRSGDLARWNEDGNLEYIGRADDQVKIRGFRIELGEIEAALNRHPAVAQAVVIAREDTPGHKRLVAYLTLQSANVYASHDDLRGDLSALLPEYMMPSAFVWLSSLPLTANGKLDRRALPAPDLRASESSRVAPRTQLERTLCEVWSQILGVQEVGIHDNYLTHGGDSITAIRIASALLPHGWKVNVGDLLRYPTIAELTSHVTAARPQKAVRYRRTAPLTPIQAQFFQHHLVDPEHFNHTVLLRLPAGIDAAAVQAVLAKIWEHHESLRLRFRQRLGIWVQEIAPASPPFPLHIVDDLPTQGAALQTGFDLSTGPLFRAAYYKAPDAARLLLIVHHLVVDGVSWRILLEDLVSGCRQLQLGQDIFFPTPASSYTNWALQLRRYSRSGEAAREAADWLAESSIPSAPIPIDIPEGSNQYAYGRAQTFELSTVETGSLLTAANAAYNTSPEDILVCGLLAVLLDWTGGNSIALEIENHGRESIFEDIDIGRTVGWFTSLYPVLFHRDRYSDIGPTLRSVKERLQHVPHGGIGYGVWRYLSKAGRRHPSALLERTQVRFNFLGNMDSDTAVNAWQIDTQAVGDPVSSRAQRPRELEISVIVRQGRLHASITYSAERFHSKTIASLASRYRDAICEILRHCSNRQVTELTPSDLSYSALSLEEFDRILS